MSQTPKVLLFGAHSMVGEDVNRKLKESFEVEAHSRKDFDLADIPALNALLKEKEYDFIVYAAGLTDPEACEKEKEKSMFLNTEIPLRIARLIAKKQTRFVYFSDAMVFDGKQKQPYEEDDIPNPLSTYGKSRFVAESELLEILDTALVLRTSWPFGKKMKGILKKLLEIHEEKGELHVADNYFGSPIYTVEAARLTCELMKQKGSGIFHLTTGECCSWYDYAKEIVRIQKGEDAASKVLPQKTDAAHLDSTRPVNSCLASKRLAELGLALPSWKESMRDFLGTAF